jgi:hypothetical protein
VVSTQSTTRYEYRVFFFFFFFYKITIRPYVVMPVCRSSEQREDLVTAQYYILCLTASVTNFRTPSITRSPGGNCVLINEIDDQAR